MAIDSAWSVRHYEREFSCASHSTRGLSPVATHRERGNVQGTRRMMELMRRVESWLDSLRRPARGKVSWPAMPGKYRVANAQAPVAVCTLSSNELISRVQGQGIAIIGRAYTPNLGLEKIVLNVLTNPHIRFLIVCGRENPVFQVGQTLQSLFSNGVDENSRIIGAAGLLAELKGLSTVEVEAFRRQVTLVDMVGEMRPDVIAARAEEAASASQSPVAESVHVTGIRRGEPRVLTAGGRRQPMDYDRLGFFVITVHSDEGEIEVQHFSGEGQLANLIRGHSGEAIRLALLEAGLLSQLSHAAYLGAELAKAEMALRLGLVYDQDQPVRRAEPVPQA